MDSRWSIFGLRGKRLQILPAISALIRDFVGESYRRAERTLGGKRGFLIEFIIASDFSLPRRRSHVGFLHAVRVGHSISQMKYYCALRSSKEKQERSLSGEKFRRAAEKL